MPLLLATNVADASMDPFRRRCKLHNPLSFRASKPQKNLGGKPAEGKHCKPDKRQ